METRARIEKSWASFRDLIAQGVCDRVPTISQSMAMYLPALAGLEAGRLSEMLSLSSDKPVAAGSAALLLPWRGIDELLPISCGFFDLKLARLAFLGAPLPSSKTFAALRFNGFVCPSCACILLCNDFQLLDKPTDETLIATSYPGSAKYEQRWRANVTNAQAKEDWSWKINSRRFGARGLRAKKVAPSFESRVSAPPRLTLLPEARQLPLPLHPQTSINWTRQIHQSPIFISRNKIAEDFTTWLRATRTSRLTRPSREWRPSRL